MLRLVLDSNAVDSFVNIEGAFEAARAAVDVGELEILWTHFTVDELVRMSDPERRARLVLVLMGLARLVPTGTFVVDSSRLDPARLAGNDDQEAVDDDQEAVDDDQEAVDDLSSRSVRHIEDALIGITAQFEDVALASNDRRLAARARDR